MELRGWGLLLNKVELLFELGRIAVRIGGQGLYPSVYRSEMVESWSGRPESFSLGMYVGSRRLGRKGRQGAAKISCGGRRKINTQLQGLHLAD